jgi:hypothetical protein
MFLWQETDVLVLLRLENAMRLEVRLLAYHRAFLLVPGMKPESRLAPRPLLHEFFNGYRLHEASVRFQVFTVETVKNIILWDVTPYAVAQLLKIFPTILEAEGLLSCSQDLSTGPCPEIVESNPYHHILSNISLDVIVPPTSKASLVVCILLASPPISCMNSPSHRCVIHALLVHPPWSDYFVYTLRRTNVMILLAFFFFWQNLFETAVTFYNETILRQAVSSTSNSQAEDRPLAAIPDYLFNIFAVLHIWRPPSPSATWGRTACLRIVFEMTRLILKLRFSRFGRFTLWSSGLWQCAVIEVDFFLGNLVLDIQGRVCREHIVPGTFADTHNTTHCLNPADHNPAIIQMFINIVCCKFNTRNLAFLRLRVLIAVAVWNTVSWDILTYNVWCRRSKHEVSLKPR